MLEIDVLTIFPELLGPFLETAFVGMARRDGAARIDTHDLRDWATDRHRSVDDTPYGGGPGMVMTPEPLIPAIEALAGPKGPGRKVHVICLSPQGQPLDQPRLADLAAGPPLLFVCGRYEGIDQRVLDLAVDEELSIGDYVLSEEIPTMVAIEAGPAAPGGARKSGFDRNRILPRGSFLEGPQYTRPPIYRGLEVPRAALGRPRRHRVVAARPGLKELALEGPNSSKLLRNPGRMQQRTWTPALRPKDRKTDSRASRRPARTHLHSAHPTHGSSDPQWSPYRAAPCPGWTGPVRRARRTSRETNGTQRKRPMRTLDFIENKRSAATSRRSRWAIPSRREGARGDKERIQVFQGLVIRRRGAGVSETFTVRKISSGVGVERVFPSSRPW